MSKAPGIVTMSEQNPDTVNQTRGIALVISRAKSTGAGRRLVGGDWIFSQEELCRFHDLLIAVGMAEAAIICDGEADAWRHNAPGSSGPIYDHKADAANDLAALIRACAPKPAERDTLTVGRDQ